MAKEKTVFSCSKCGYQSLKWVGCCPGCDSWNTLVEELHRPGRSPGTAGEREIRPLNALDGEDTVRFSCGNSELDRVLGGGIVPGSLVLLGGEPGIGKSTLLLQIADYLGRSGRRVLYLSGEESSRQIKLRAERLRVNGDSIYILNEANLDLIDGYIGRVNPDLVIIDSIQTVYVPDVGSIPGSVSQLRESAARIMELAKKNDRPFILIGHVTKDGSLAGPKILEHMVDTVIYFEGDTNNYYRILRTVKNRFGPANEIGILEMTGSGLREVDNPTRVFVEHRSGMPGLAVVASFEGTRPILVEVEALVIQTTMGYPRRMASGIEANRLSLLAAVLEKRGGLTLGNKDIYIKVAGGTTLRDPSTDLGIAMAITSSFYENPLPHGSIIIGEIGLSGEIRSVPFLGARVKEAQKMGFTRAFVPREKGGEDFEQVDMEIIEVESLNESMGKCGCDGGRYYEG